MLSKLFLNVTKSPKRFVNPLMRRLCSGLTDHSNRDTDNSSNKEAIEGRQIPPEPTHCCNSGCVNCVWIKYAQELTQLFDNGDVIARKKISEKVEDPKMRAFLFAQLGLRNESTWSSKKIQKKKISIFINFVLN